MKEDEDTKEDDTLSMDTAMYSATTVVYSNVNLINLPNGLEYFGQTNEDIENLPNGIGLAKYARNLFIGEWKCESATDTLKSSIGLIMNMNSSFRYEGEIELSLGDKPVAKGFGQIVYKDGSVRCGQFIDNSIDGLGIEIDSSDNQIFLGQFESDKFNGAGVCYHGNGDVYSGWFSKGMRNGYGEYLSFNGAKCLAYKGIWKNDKLELSTESDSPQLLEALEKTELVSAKALKIYEVFNRSISRRVASIRTKVMKMIIHFSKTDLSSKERIRVFILELIESKMYRLGTSSAVPSIQAIQERINQSIQQREAIELKNTEKEIENESLRLIEKAAREKADTVPDQANTGQPKLVVSVPIYQENHTYIYDRLDQKIEEEEELPLASNLNINTNPNEIAQNLEEVQHDSQIKTETAVFEEEKDSKAKRLADDKDSLVNNDVNLMNPPKRDAPEADLESLSKNTEHGSRGTSENKNLSTKHSVTSFASLGKDTFQDFESATSNFSIPRSRQKTTGIPPNLDISSDKINPNIPTRPGVVANDPGDGYFTFKIKPPESSDQYRILKVLEARKKLQGVRQYISSKFMSQQQLVQQIDDKEANKSKNRDFTVSEHFHTTESESAPDWDQILNEVSKVQIDDENRAKYLLKKTLQHEFSDYEEVSPSGTKVAREEYEDEILESVSKCGETYGDSEISRGNFQTAELCINTYNTRQTERNAEEQEIILPPPPPPLPPSKEENMTSSLQNQKSKMMISPPPMPPPPRSDTDTSNGFTFVSEEKVLQKDMIRLLFQRQPKPPPPPYMLPTPPRSPPRPPSVPPPPPSVEPRPPRRPPYPPPI